MGQGSRLKFRYIVQIKQNSNWDWVCKVAAVLVVGSTEADR